MASDNANYARVKRWRERHRGLLNLRRREAYHAKKNLSGGVESRHAELGRHVPGIDAGTGCMKRPPRGSLPNDLGSGSSAPPAQSSKIAELRQLIAAESEKPIETPVSVPTVFRDDYGRVISETQWKRLQSVKERAREGNYELYEWSQ